MPPDTTQAPADRPAAEGPPPFIAVVNEHWSAVYRLLHALTNDTHETEDLTQETFLRALARLPTFRPETNVRAWLLRIASNAFIDERRKRKRARTGPLAHDPPGSEPVPGRALEDAEQGERVRAALRGLSDLTRLVFHLRAQEELSFKEIAGLAGTTEQAARWHMRHARVVLLARLADDD